MRRNTLKLIKLNFRNNSLFARGIHASIKNLLQCNGFKNSPFGLIKTSKSLFSTSEKENHNEATDSLQTYGHISDGKKNYKIGV